ncbi:MAG: CDP-alcohol phosphatidyltransferase family protein [Planctomycetaceae bacterium]
MKRALPNAITALRLLLIPLFAFLAVADRPLDAAVTLAVIALSDWLDGLLARRLRVESALGAVLDPLADKLTQLTALALLTVPVSPRFTRVPVAFLALVLARELVLLYGAVRIRLRRARVAIRPRWEGKRSTLLVFLLLLCACLGAPEGVVMLLAGVTAPLVVVSAVRYVLDGRRQLAGADLPGAAARISKAAC